MVLNFCQVFYCTSLKQRSFSSVLFAVMATDWCLSLFLQVPVSSWFDDMSDTELMDLMPFFENLARVDNVYSLLRTTAPESPSTTPPS